MTLPPGFAVTLAHDTILLGEGRTVLGGSPLTALKLSPKAHAVFRGPRITVTDPTSAAVAERLLATNLGVPDLTEAAGISPTEVTVVVPVRDRPAQLDRCLAPLTGLAVIVVDDASVRPDDVRNVVLRHGATYVRLPVNLGPAGARNAGLRLVATPYVAFVDSDVQVSPDALLELARHFADPAVVLVGPRVVGTSTGPKPRWFERYEAHASSLTLGTRAGQVRPGAAVAWLPSACLVARVTALGDGFDAQRRVGEDVDLVWRLTDAGHRVRYEPDVTAYHATRATVRSWLGRKFFYGTGSAALGVRHGDHVAPAALSPSYAVAAAAILTRHRVAVPLAAAALARGHRKVGSVLPAESESRRVATRLAARGLGWAVRQESALLLRHWWPAALLGASLSRQTRRALATALLVDAAVAIKEHPAPSLRELPAHVSARRLDDLSYGAGLWYGALLTRSVRALLPRRVR